VSLDSGLIVVAVVTPRALDGPNVTRRLTLTLNADADSRSENAENLKEHNWSQYKFLSTLPASRMPGGGKKAPRRVVMIGDIHGSYKPLQ
jgi:hypothetical protein